ncbi:MAG: hypothetical protein VKJ04_00740 [Vampirovibrionales bacterium]|nr:hypothetical protein [Vampirovibrionales bacterium]
MNSVRFGFHQVYEPSNKTVQNPALLRTIYPDVAANASRVSNSVVIVPPGEKEAFRKALAARPQGFGVHVEEFPSVGSYPVVALLRSDDERVCDGYDVASYGDGQRFLEQRKFHTGELENPFINRYRQNPSAVPIQVPVSHGLGLFKREA